MLDRTTAAAPQEADGAFPAERRSEPRQATNQPARLFYGPGLARWVDIIVKDRSPSGAKIQAPAIFDLPNKLVLLDYEEGVAYEAQLRWRKAELAGIKLASRYDLRFAAPEHMEEVRKAWEALGGMVRRSSAD